MAADEPKVTFEADVKPILRKHCLTCHNGERPRGDLDLSSYAAVMFGGVSGKAVVAGKADASPLYTLAAHLEDPKMPPNKPKIPQRELDTIRKWIDGGLIEKAAGAAKTATATPAPAGGLAAAAACQRPTPITALAVSPAAPLVAVSGPETGAGVRPAGRQVARRRCRSPRAKSTPCGSRATARSSSPAAESAGSRARWSGSRSARGSACSRSATRPTRCSPRTSPADKTRVVFGGPGRVVKVVSVPDGKLVHTFRKPTDWVLSVGFSPEGLLVAAGDRFGGLYVWEAKSGKEFLTLRGHTKGVTGLAWRADSDALASCSEDGTVRVWDMHTGSRNCRSGTRTRRRAGCRVPPERIACHRRARRPREGVGRNRKASGRPRARLPTRC